ncbi:unnamed protein product [Cylicocyclus nassatus]|uniref:Pyrrolo-quinoline quinone repeat domain-containing protein n=1 Tax=Cylicocyclus nassatus TaxID=53992 RepID=A0AA36MCG0_CYLNA|nr:unnamed protein product [Cylicocyclus nassatus]
MSISEVLHKYGSSATKTIDENLISTVAVVNIPLRVVEQPNVSWAFDMKKCIDGTPLLTQLCGEDVVAACSHSGLVVCVRVRDGRCLWKTQITTRFEASVARSGEYFVLGGYDGNVYFLSMLNAYDRKLYKLDSRSRKCVWSCLIQSGSPACPLLLERTVIVTTIKGSVEAIDINEGVHVWTFEANAPVFSAVSPYGTSGFVGSVDGTVMKIGLDNGEKELAVNIHEPVFSEVRFLNDLIYIVTERGSLFVADSMLNILRHFRFESHRFVVPPMRMDVRTVCIVSSYGSLIIYDEGGNCARAFRLGGGHVFSSVVYLKEKGLALVGCRDNFLRCFIFPSISD